MDDKQTEVPSSSGPLPPERRASYAVAIEQTRAVLALEGMAPTEQDEAIDAAILAGRVSPEQAREELLAYVYEHRSVDGFIKSRTWA